MPKTFWYSIACLLCGTRDLVKATAKLHLGFHWAPRVEELSTGNRAFFPLHHRKTKNNSFSPTQEVTDMSPSLSRHLMTCYTMLMLKWDPHQSSAHAAQCSPHQKDTSSPPPRCWSSFSPVPLWLSLSVPRWWVAERWHLPLLWSVPWPPHGMGQPCFQPCPQPCLGKSSSLVITLKQSFT